MGTLSTVRKHVKLSKLFDHAVFPVRLPSRLVLLMHLAISSLPSTTEDGDNCFEPCGMHVPSQARGVSYQQSPTKPTITDRQLQTGPSSGVEPRPPGPSLT